MSLVSEHNNAKSTVFNLSSKYMLSLDWQGENGASHADTELLREQMRVIADELDRKEAALETLQNGDSADNVDVELQLCHLLLLPS